MCGRFANHLTSLQGWETLLTEWPETAETGFNIPPSQAIPAFTRTGGLAMRWGLIPHWSQEISPKYSTFNARVETLAEKPAFRHAWSRRQRCLIPALGYYEWRTTESGKQPCFVTATDQPLIVFAGLYEPARTAALPASCTIITQPATGEMTRLHPRMPIMLDQESARHWISDTAEFSGGWNLITGTPSLRFYAVSRKVNSPANQGAELITPVEDPV